MYYINANANKKQMSYITKSKHKNISFAKSLKSLKNYCEEHTSLQGNLKYDNPVDITILKPIDLNLINVLEQWKQEPRKANMTHWFQNNNAILDTWVKTVKLPNGLKPKDLTPDQKKDIQQYLSSFVNEIKKNFYPNNELIGASIHWDETSPHIHFQFLNYDLKKGNWGTHKEVKDAIKFGKLKEFEKKFNDKYEQNVANWKVDNSCYGMEWRVYGLDNGSLKARNQKELKNEYPSEEERVEERMYYLEMIGSEIEEWEERKNGGWSKEVEKWLDNQCRYSKDGSISKKDAIMALKEEINTLNDLYGHLMPQPFIYEFMDDEIEAQDQQIGIELKNPYENKDLSNNEQKRGGQGR